MKKILKSSFIRIILLTAIMILFSFGYINAVQNEVKKDYTEDYIKWLKLPEKERKNYIQPSMYSINYAEQKSNSKFYMGKSNLQTKYCLLDDVDFMAKNQEKTASCWAFATSTALETNIQMRLKKDIKLSPRHMEYSTSKTFLDGINNHGYNREVGDGGNAQIALNYITAGYGPVLEKDMPFENNNDKISLSQIENKNIPIQVTEHTELPAIYKEYNNDGTISKYTNGYSENSESRIEYTNQQVEEIRDQIKNHIINYGALVTHTYMKNNQYLNKSDKMYEYYCNNSDIISNHVVTIVGWDDDYKKENFSSEYGQPEHDGAYLVLNSWGMNWSSLGFFYISYDDIFVERNLVGIVETKNKEYDNIYQHDILGPNGAYGYKGTNIAYIGSKFDRTNSCNIETLEEISFTISSEMNVDIYINANNSDFNKEKSELIGNLNNLKPGYHTFELENPIMLKNKEYSVVLKCKNLESNDTVFFPAEIYTEDGLWNTAVVKEGETFISKNGETWKDTSNNNYNLCIKGFTKEYNNLQNISVEGCNEQYVYTGTQINPKIKVKDGDSNLIENVDYEVTYSDNLNAGIAKLIIKGIGNYSGTYEKTFNIVARDITKNESNLPIITYNIDTSDKLYTRKPITIAIEMKQDNNKLIENTDYSVQYENNKEIGIATVIVTGIGNYSGEIIEHFKIKNVTEDDWGILDPERCYSGIYEYILDSDGNAIIIDINNEDVEDLIIPSELDGHIVTQVGKRGTIFECDGIKSIKLPDTVKTIGFCILSGGELIKEIVIPRSVEKILANSFMNNDIIEKIYILNNNIQISSGAFSKCNNLAIYIDKENNNIIEYAKRWKLQYQVYNSNVKDLQISLNDSCYYTGNAINNNICIRDENYILKENIDYTVEYNNNINVGTATVNIKGIGHYVGSITKEFNILPKSISDIVVNIDSKSKEYTGKIITVPISVKDGNVDLVEGTDYIVSYENNINVGTAKVKVTLIGNYTGTSTVGFVIYKKEEPQVITISNPDKVSLYSVKNVKTKGAKVTWKKDSNVDGYEVYMATVSKDKNNMKTTAELSIRKKTSTKSKELKLIPKGAKVKIIKKNVKKAEGYTWYKVKYKGKTGYVASKYLEEIYKEGSYKKVKTISKNSTTNYTKKKLSKNKTYAFKVRGFKTVNGQKYYGLYSESKKVTIKK